MTIGALRHRVIIEQRVDEADGQGGFTSTWRTFTQSWGAIKPASARERFFAGKVEHNITHLMRIRSAVGVTAAMRVVHKGRVLQIRGVRPDDEDRGQWTILYLEEGVAS